jgi:DNA mismatch endonuclease (patch repair protein)
MTDVYSIKKRGEIMSRVRNKKTNAEESVSKILKQLDLRFKQNVSSLPGSPDFVINKYNTVILVNGCFWHGHSECKRAKLPSTNVSFWRNKIGLNKKRDASQIRLLRKKGWRVFVVWQCKIRNAEKLKNHLSRIRKHSMNKIYFRL